MATWNASWRNQVETAHPNRWATSRSSALRGLTPVASALWRVKLHPSREPSLSSSRHYAETCPRLYLHHNRYQLLPHLSTLACLQVKTLASLPNKKSCSHHASTALTLGAPPVTSPRPAPMSRSTPALCLASTSCPLPLHRHRLYLRKAPCQSQDLVHPEPIRTFSVQRTSPTRWAHCPIWRVWSRPPWNELEKKNRPVNGRSSDSVSTTLKPSSRRAP